MKRDESCPIDVTDIAPLRESLDRIELPIEVRLGRYRWSLERVLRLRVGDPVPIGPEGGETVMLYVQGQPFATGDLVVVNGRFAFRVAGLVEGGEERRR